MITLSTKGSGSSIKLKADVVGSSKKVKWTTSNKAVATVNGSGVVKGKSTGEAVITATANGVSATCKVVVNAGSISLSEEKVSMFVDETKKLKSNASKNETATWTSSNPEVVTVDAKGYLTAKGVGDATITVSGNNTSDTCIVRVDEANTRIGEDTVELHTKGTDKTFQLGLQVIGRKSKVTWASSDKKVASVNAKGVLTAKKEGRTTITATANGVSDSVVVIVKDYVPSIDLNYDEYTLYTGKGNKVTLKAKIDGPSKKAQWNTSDPTVATVDSGKVTAIKEGEVVITATSNGVSEDCVMTIKESDVILGQEQAYLSVGEVIDLPVDVVGVSPKVKYATTNAKVATVKNGSVTAKSTGTAEIVVTANGVTKACPIVVDECPHEWDVANAVVTKEPTCAETGERSITCKLCQLVQKETIPVTEHTYVESNRINATCTTDGAVTYTCSVCQDTKQEVLAHEGHTYGNWIVVTKPSNFTWGIDKQYCNNCRMENARLVPPLAHEDWEHTYEEVITPPTCTTEGFSTFTCVCGDTYTDKVTPKTDHNFGEWIITKPATEEEEGIKSRVCLADGCDASEDEVIPRVDHVHNYTTEVVAPTCVDRGYTVYTCRCGDTYNSDYVDAIGHSWDAGTVLLAATCVSEGTKEFKCTVCESTRVDTIPIDLDKHTPAEEFTLISDATCTSDGHKAKYCTLCNKVLEEETIKALGHDYSEWETVRDAVCEKGGLQLRSCNVCGFLESKGLDMTGHSWDNDFTVDLAPTCTTEGSRSIHCSKCSAVRDSEVVPALDHDYPDEFTVTLKPTCTEAGHEERKCTRCDKVEGQIVPANGHTSVSDNSVSANCISTGLTAGEHCSVCGFVLTAQEVIPALGHDCDDVVTDPTCLNKGFTTHTCKRCDNVSVDTYTDALNHTWGDWSNVTAPTCTKDGTITRSCSRCEAVDTGTVPALGHDYAESSTVDKEPTCLVEGSESKHCSRCDSKEEVKSITATGHDFTEPVYTWVASKEACTAVRVCKNDASHVETETVQAVPTVLREANCETIGEVKYTATFENEAFEQQEVTVESLALGHTVVTDKAVEPTCESTGLTEGSHCLVCNTVLVEQQVLPASGHDWNDGVVTKAPTCVDTGIKEFTCETCGAIRNDVLDSDADAHKPNTDFVVTTEATCTTDGVKELFCTLCNESLQSESISATGHKFGEWVVIDSPTCDASGTKKRTCVICDFPETEGLNAAGHKWESTYTVDVPATCESDGSESIHCSVCDIPKESRPIPATGHNYPDLYATVTEATCTTAGSKVRECKTCGREDVQPISKLEHVEVTDPAVAVTCTANGKTEGKHCSRCDAVLVAQQDIDATGHSYGNPSYDWTTDSTCEASVTCSKCGDVCKELGTVTRSVTPATCVSDGNETFTATFKDAKFETRTNVISIDSEGHQYGTPTYSWNGTSSCTGTRVCAICGGGKETKTSTSITPVTTAATCEGLGKTVYTAAFSSPYSNQTKEVAIKALGHSYGSPVTVTNVTCTSDGTIKRTCTRTGCGAVETQTITKPGHATSSDYRIVTPETCTTAGTESKYCTRCGVNVGATRSRSALTHSYGTPFYEWNVYASCTGKRVCSRCGDVESRAGTMQRPIVTKYATCTDTGITQHKATFRSPYATQTKNETTPKLGHLYVDNKCVHCSIGVAGAYDENGIMLASWDELVNTYGLDVEKDYTSPSMTTAGSARAVLNNTALKSTTTLVISDTVKTLGNYAFYYCSNLTRVIIPNSVTKIGSNSFVDCIKLTTIDIPEGVTSIGSFAFQWCSSLTSVHLPSSVTSLGSMVFKECTNLSVITVDSKNTVYDSRNNCNAIVKKDGNVLVAGCKTTVIPSTVKVLGYGAFHLHSSLTSINIPDSVTAIENYALSGTGLTTIKIPDTVTTIGEYAFQSCSKLTTICYDGAATGFPWSAPNATLHNYVDGVCSVCGLKSLCEVTIVKVETPKYVENDNVICTNCGSPGGYAVFYFDSSCGEHFTWTTATHCSNASCNRRTIPYRDSLHNKASDLTVGASFKTVDCLCTKIGEPLEVSTRPAGALQCSEWYNTLNNWYANQRLVLSGAYYTEQSVINNDQSMRNVLNGSSASFTLDSNDPGGRGAYYLGNLLYYDCNLTDVEVPMSTYIDLNVFGDESKLSCIHRCKNFRP